MAKSKNPRLCQLKTPFEDNSKSSWQKEYPRPQLKRDNWQSLCGSWQLSVKTADNRTTDLGDIIVPYPPESRISGVMRLLAENEQYIYNNTFALDGDCRDKKILLHFGAVDTHCTVFVNGLKAGSHSGGYLPFSLDITHLVFTDKENTITVEVSDPLDIELAYGKQKRNRGGMWYTPVSGIWQPVWLESVVEKHIENIRITPYIDRVDVEVFGGEEEKQMVISTPDGDIVHSFSGSKTTVQIDNAVNWTPENPYLYTFTITR